MKGGDENESQEFSHAVYGSSVDMYMQSLREINQEQWRSIMRVCSCGDAGEDTGSDDDSSDDDGGRVMMFSAASPQKQRR